MPEEPVDDETWRTFAWTDAKKFAWDACREVAVDQSYDTPWTFQNFLLVSKRKAYKADDNVTVDSFFNKNSIYLPFLEEVIKEVVFWGFFSKQDDTLEIADSVYLPTSKIKEYHDILVHFQDGELDKIETYHIPRDS